MLMFPQMDYRHHSDLMKPVCLFLPMDAGVDLAAADGRQAKKTRPVNRRHRVAASPRLKGAGMRKKLPICASIVAAKHP